ncbi:hypothetical protein BBP40_007808 [Aspergillus hancockii]|nr:hypothetical protein BBP40_007808 [Aspergillus hancockii]
MFSSDISDNDSIRQRSGGSDTKSLVATLEYLHGNPPNPADASRQDVQRLSAVTDPESTIATIRCFHESPLQLSSIISQHEGASL